MSEVPLYGRSAKKRKDVTDHHPRIHHCEDRVLDGPASEEKGSKGRN